MNGSNRKRISAAEVNIGWDILKRNWDLCLDSLSS